MKKNNPKQKQNTVCVKYGKNNNNDIIIMDWKDLKQYILIKNYKRIKFTKKNIDKKVEKKIIKN